MPQIHITLDEWIRKIMEGERDFRYIKLDPSSNLGGHESFQELSRYLKTQDLQSNPMVLDDSDLYNLHASDLYLPHVKARDVKAQGVYLAKATLTGADFSRADLSYSIFREAQMEHSILASSNLYLTCFIGANLQHANFQGAYNLDTASFMGANVKGATFDSANQEDVRSG